MFRYSTTFVWLLGTALLLVACGVTPQTKHARAIARAKQLIEKRDFGRAALECRTAIQSMPKAADGYYELGVALAGSHDLQSAVMNFRKALQLDPKHGGAQLELGKLMASASDPKVVEQAEKRMADLLNADPANTEALDTLALAELKLGNTDKAIGTLDRVLTSAPGSLRSAVLLAQAQSAKKEFAAAEKTLVDLCAHSPHSVEPRVVLASFYVSQGRKRDAERQLTIAVNENPRSSEALFALAQVQLSAGETSEATQSFAHLSTLADPPFRFAYSAFLFQQGRRDEAIRDLERLVHSNANDREARSHLVDGYWSTGRKADAKRLLSDALAKNPNDAEALVQMASVSLFDRDYGQAERYLDAILHQDPKSLAAHYLRARVDDAQGKTLLERQELSDALQIRPGSLRVRLELARLLVQTNGVASALQVLDEAPAFQKKLPAYLVEHNWALLATGDMPALRRGIDEGMARGLGTEVVVQNGYWNLKAGRYAEAAGAFETALHANPEDVRALEGLLSSYGARKNMAEGLNKVREDAQRAPHSAPVLYLLGKSLAANGRESDAREAYLKSRAADAHYEPAQIALIRSDMTAGRLDGARREVEELLRSDANNKTARLWLGDLTEVAGDHAGALREYQKVLEVDPADPQALNNVAYLLTDFRNQPDEAMKYAEKAQEIAPENPNYMDTLGWVLYRKGLYSLAAKNFENASAKPGAAPVCTYHLAMAYAKLGDRDRGHRALKLALQKDPKLPEAQAAEALLQ